MVLPTGYNLKPTVPNESLSSQQEQSITKEKIGPMNPESSSMTLERLPRPPQDPLNMAMFEKYLKERNPDPITPLERLGQNLNKNIEQNPYGHETPDSNPPTPLSASSEDSDLPLGASIDDVF